MLIDPLLATSCVVVAAKLIGKIRLHRRVRAKIHDTIQDRALHLNGRFHIGAYRHAPLFCNIGRGAVRWVPVANG